MRVIIPLNLDSWPAHRRSFFVRFLAGLGIRAKRVDPVVITITEIRNEIFADSQASWETRATSRLLSRIFHESISELFRPGPRSWKRALTPADFADTGTIERHLYEYFVAHRLMRYQGALKESTAEVLRFWTAIKDWCEWFRGIVQDGLAQKLIQYDEETNLWIGADNLVDPDRHLTFTFTDPSWTAPVMIQGRGDALLRKPGTNDWFITEYRAGAPHTDEADLTQAIMYSLMLEAADAAAITVIQFDPQLKETAYTGHELTAGLELIKPLVARLAGVLPDDGTGERLLLESPAEERALVSTGTTGQELARQRPVGVDQTGERIVSVCKEFGADVTLVGQPAAGSTFIRYQLDPGEGVSARKISSLALDLQIRLGLEASPLIRLDRGRLAIDVARQDRQMVTFSSVRAQFPRTDVSSRVPLGVDLLGSLKFADLANPVSAHMLVAGCSGSGKTEWLRVAIAGLALQNTPASLRLALIDTKGDAFAEWANSPFLMAGENSLVCPSKSTTAVQLLDAVIEEMESRFRAMAEEGVEELARTHVKWPRIVVVCDEYADVVTNRPERIEVESRIAHLGAKARPVGIHMIIATQRPSRDVIEGTLKANLPARVALRMNSSIESRLVLGCGGAESLLGAGDLLYLDTGVALRYQAPLLSPAERNELASEVAALR